MKELVKRACGHEETVEVFGTAAERAKKIAWYESTPCTDCYRGEGCEAVEMLYKDYKNNYPDCKTKAGSYDKKAKTIIVYVPVKETAEEIKTEPVEEATEESIEESPKTIEEKLLAIGIPEEHVSRYASTPPDELMEMYIRLENSFNGNIRPRERKNLDTVKMAIELLREEGK